MEYNLKKEAKLFMIFDILGDTERSGPLLWKIDRKRLEDVKNHVVDLLFIARILRKYFPPYLDFDKINDYIMCHDLPEAITGDITIFEGVSREEIKKVTNMAIHWLSSQFDDVLDFSSIFNRYENRMDIESKVVHMLDRVHSFTTFSKYQSEQDINLDHPDIIRDLRNDPFVAPRIAEGKDLADIFFEFHLAAVNFNGKEIEKYGISSEDANRMSNVIRTFATEIYSQKQKGAWTKVQEDFPPEAMKYNRNKTYILEQKVGNDLK